MRKTINFDTKCFVDLRDRQYCPQLPSSTDAVDARVEHLAVSILDAFGKGYLYTKNVRTELNARVRLEKLLENHKTKKKLIIISHVDWVFDNVSFVFRQTVLVTQIVLAHLGLVIILY